MERTRVGVQRAVGPAQGSRAFQSSFTGLQELRILTIPPPPVLFSSFILVGRGGGVLPRFFPVSFTFLPDQGSHRLGHCRAVTSHCSSVLFLHSCLHPGVVGRVGWGGATFFPPLPLRLSTEKDASFPGWGGGGRQWLASCLSRGSRIRSLKKPREDRIGERISQGGVTLSAVGSRSLEELAFFPLS